MAKWRVLIADDHPIVLAGLRATDLSREHQQPYRIEAKMHQYGIIQPSSPMIGQAVTHPRNRRQYDKGWAAGDMGQSEQD